MIVSDLLRRVCALALYAVIFYAARNAIRRLNTPGFVSDRVPVLKSIAVGCIRLILALVACVAMAVIAFNILWIFIALIKTLQTNDV